jgi:hypothetical protein
MMALRDCFNRSPMTVLQPLRWPPTLAGTIARLPSSREWAVFRDAPLESRQGKLGPPSPPGNSPAREICSGGSRPDSPAESKSASQTQQSASRKQRARCVHRSRYREQPNGLLALDPQLICYSSMCGIPDVALVVFERKSHPEIQYLKATISEATPGIRPYGRGDIQTNRICRVPSSQRHSFPTERSEVLSLGTVSRRKQITSHEQANVYLRNEYLPEDNQRFAHAAARPEDCHCRVGRRSGPGFPVGNRRHENRVEIGNSGLTSNWRFAVMTESTASRSDLQCAALSVISDQKESCR